MKKFLYPLAVLILLVGCSDGLFGDLSGETLNPVYLSELSDDKSIDLTEQALNALIAPILEENGRHDFDGDYAMVVNDPNVLQDIERWGEVYRWPEMDLDRYSLVIGKVQPTDMGYAVESHCIKKGLFSSVVFVTIKDITEGGPHSFGPKDCYFAGLYPKLPDGPLTVKRANGVGSTK